MFSSAFVSRWVLPTAALLVLFSASPRLFATGPEPTPSVAPGVTATVPPVAIAPPPTPGAAPGEAAVASPTVAAAPAPSPVATPAPTPNTAKNPLGATSQEIVRLYGPVLKHNARVRRHEVLEGGTALDGDLHGHNGVIIRVVYHENHAVLLEYTRVAGALTPADVKTFLDATANGSVWVQGRDSSEATKYYRRTDERAIAHYSTEYDGSLLIAAEGFDHDKLLDNMMH